MTILTEQTDQQHTGNAFTISGRRVLFRCLVFPVVLASSIPCSSTMVVVSTLNDVQDGDVSSIKNLQTNPGPDTDISFREAILAANNTPGPDVFAFSVSGTIVVTTALPPVEDMTGGLVIDGDDRITVDGNTLPTWELTLDPESVPLLENGFVVLSPNNHIRDISVIRFPGSGIVLSGTAARGNRVTGCLVGTDGHIDLGCFRAGIRLENGAEQNQIGGPLIAERNIVSGNMDGIVVWGTASRNRIEGNYIGTDRDGTAAIPNYWIWFEEPGSVVFSGTGIGLFKGARENVVGSAQAGNLISANHAWGIYIRDSSTRENIVQGNHFVVDETPGAPIRPDLRSSGVYIENSAGNIVGGALPGMGNEFDAYYWTGSWGIDIAYRYSTGNRVQGNVFRSPAGLGPFQETGAIRAHVGPSGNLLGGTNPGEGNVIVGRPGVGVESVPFNAVCGNSISANGNEAFRIQVGWLPQLAAPVIIGANPIRGTAHPCSSVDVFVDPEDEGQVYLGAIEADACGNFVLDANLSSYAGWNITATATSSEGNTSMYSAPFPVSGGVDREPEEPPGAKANCACTGKPHSADANGSWHVGLSELLLVIQLYKGEGFRCYPPSPDYYVPLEGVNWNPPPDGGGGMLFCTPHDADYRPRDWRIELVELMRVIQFYNSPGYTVCAGSEDGFCPAAS